MINRKGLLKASRLVMLYLKLCLLLGLCTLLYAKFIEPNWIEINSLPLTLPHLAPEFNGYRVVQISDLHRDRWMTPKKINRIVRLVNQQNPDLVVITGDLVTRNLSQLIPSLGDTLNHLTPKDQTIAVLGNHDYENDYQAIIKVLAKAGITHLGNEVFTLQRGNATLHIAGVDDITAKKDRLDVVLQKLPPKGAAILLVHEPDFAKTSSKTGRFDLQLSGHTHGGQIRLPLIRPIILPPWGRKYYWGFYQVRKMYLYTNRGLGMTGIHFRLGSRPEITVFTLLSPSE